MDWDFNVPVKTFEYDGLVHTTSEIQEALNSGYSIINLGGNSFKKNGVVTAFRNNVIIDGNGATLYGTSGNSGFFQVTGKNNVTFKNFIMKDNSPSTALEQVLY